MHEFPAAISDYTSAIEITEPNTKLAVAYHNRGCARSWMDDFDGALSDYDKAITQNPTNDVMYWNRGAAKARLGDCAGAVFDFKVAVLLNPTNFEARAELQLAERALSLQTNDASTAIERPDR